MDVKRKADLPSPSYGICEQASYRCATGCTSCVDDIEVPLPLPPFPQRDDIAQQNTHYGRHAASANTSKSPRGNQFWHGPRHSAEEAANAENGVGNQESHLAAEDVTELAIQGLEGGEGEEVPGQLLVGEVSKDTTGE